MNVRFYPALTTHPLLPKRNRKSIAHNARRLGEVADWVRLTSEYHKRFRGATGLRFPLRPPFR